MRSTQREDGADSVLGRATQLLFAFTPQDSALPLGELARRAHLAKSTAHRLCATLCEAQMLEKTDKGYYLGLRLFEVGALAPRQRGVKEASANILADLRSATGETVHLAVRDELDVLYLDKLTGSSRGPRLPSRVGGRMPLHCTAVGKALLAFSRPALLQRVVDDGLRRRTSSTIVLPKFLCEQISEIRRTGIAYEHGESTPSVVCVACPILGKDRQAVAAVSIAGWEGRLRVDTVAAAVRTASLVLSRSLAVA